MHKWIYFLHAFNEFELTKYLNFYCHYILALCIIAVCLFAKSVLIILDVSVYFVGFSLT